MRDIETTVWMRGRREAREIPWSSTGVERCVGVIGSRPLNMQMHRKGGSPLFTVTGASGGQRDQYFNLHLKLLKGLTAATLFLPFTSDGPATKRMPRRIRDFYYSVWFFPSPKIRNNAIFCRNFRNYQENIERVKYDNSQWNKFK